MPYVAVCARCYQLLPFLNGNIATPVFAKVLARPYEENPTCDTDKEANTADDGARSEVKKMEHRQKREPDRGDHTKHDEKSLTHTATCILFYAYRGNGKVHKNGDPYTIDEPAKDRWVQSFLLDIKITVCLIISTF